jgi:hypothetical protein
LYHRLKCSRVNISISSGTVQLEYDRKKKLLIGCDEGKSFGIVTAKTKNLFKLFLSILAAKKWQTEGQIYVQVWNFSCRLVKNLQATSKARLTYTVKKLCEKLTIYHKVFV